LADGLTKKLVLFSAIQIYIPVEMSASLERIIKWWLNLSRTLFINLQFWQSRSVFTNSISPFRDKFGGEVAAAGSQESSTGHLLLCTAYV